jgi:hypothetical protein
MRFTIRKMMFAIGVFTIALYIGLSYRRSWDHRRQASFYADAREVAPVRARNVESGAAHPNGYTAEEKQKAVDQARRFAVYASRMKRNYERAVFLPWLPVEPDPAPP